MKKCFGVFVGRFCPVQIGHETIIKKMIKDYGIDNCLIHGRSLHELLDASIADNVKKLFALKWEQFQKMCL
ncbi:MAG: hypothetical protein V1928_04230 [Parcubacteria group bacterium]